MMLPQVGVSGGIADPENGQDRPRPGWAEAQTKVPWTISGATCFGQDVADEEKRVGVPTVIAGLH
jgi:hypothetical protein